MRSIWGLLLIALVGVNSAAPQWRGKVQKMGEVTIVYNPDRGLWEDEPKRQLKLVPELEIGVLEGDENQMFYGVSDVKVDSRGTIYIADSGNNRIQVFDRNGRYVRTIGRKGKGPGEFLGRLKIAVDEKDHLFVADNMALRITEFNPEGKFLRLFSYSILGFNMGLVIDSRGNFYLCSYDQIKEKMIHKFNHGGQFVLSFCEPVNLISIFSRKVMLGPWGGSIRTNCTRGIIAIGDDDCIYYSQGNPYEIRKFSPDGQLLVRIYRKNKFMKSLKNFVAIKGKAITFRTPPSSVALIHSHSRDMVINTVYCPKEDKKEARSIIDFFDKDGKLLTTLVFEGKAVSVVEEDREGYLYVIDRTDYTRVIRCKVLEQSYE